jgi:hypothetical protein
MFATKTHKSALTCTVAHGMSRGQRNIKRKINGIKYLAALLHKVTGRKNRFKNKDLQ